MADPRSRWRAATSTTPAITTGLAVTLTLALIAGGGRIVTPMTVQYVLDHGLLTPQPGTSSMVLHAVVIAAAATLVAGLASWQVNLRVMTRTESALAQLRVAGLDRVHRIDPESFASARSADFVARVTSDPEAVTSFLHNGGIALFVNLSQMLIAGTIMVVYSWQLGIAVIILAILLFAVMRRIQAVVARRFGAVRVAVAAMQMTIADAIGGIHVIRSTGSAPAVGARLDGAVEETAKAQRRVLVPLHTNTALGEIAISLMTVLVVLAGVYWSTGGWGPQLGLSAGQLVAMLFLITFFVRPLQALVQLLAEAQNAVAGWRRALQLATAPVPDQGDPVHLPAGPISVRLQGVTASYDRRTPVLHTVSVHIEPGEHVAVVGHTGSGKSTLARLLTRQLRHDSGHILLGGQPIDRISDLSFQRRVAVVPQDPFLFDATIAHNIVVGVGGDITALDEIIDSLGIRAWVAGLPDGLHTRTGVRGSRLSAGERQLVALARTALVDPDLLILDEATSGVDPATDVGLTRALAALTVDRTTVTIAHRLATAEAADRVLVMDGGRLVQHGPHAELVRVDGRYADLHRAWWRHTCDHDQGRTR